MKPTLVNQKPRATSPRVHAKSKAKLPSVSDITFNHVVNRFVLEIDSLESTLPLSMKSIIDANMEVIEEFGKFLTKNGKRTGQDNLIQIDISHISEFQKLKGNLDRTSVAEALVPRSFLVALVSQYDNFLGLLIKTILLSKPEILNGSEKTFSFSELASFDSIEAAREHLIENEIESVLRESHVKQFDWLEKKFNIKLRKGLSVWPRFIEVTERRNLFVHTGGMVSGQYLKICQDYEFDCGSTAKGDVLGVDSNYFIRAYEAVFEVGVKLAHVLWRKLKPEQRMIADKNLVDISYNLLSQEKYDLAKAILDFAIDVLKIYSSADCRLRFVINRAQAYKWSGDNVRALQILDGEDFSALRDEFKLANAVLREDYKQALDIVKTIGAHGGIGICDYREWPLFREFRKQRELDSIIFEVFGEPLNKINVNEESEVVSDALKNNDASSSSRKK
jgi:hypothetical protein